MMIEEGFYLGTHVVNHVEKTDKPLFISFRQLKNRKKALKNKGRLAIDSGGFSELSLYGKWTITPQEYVDGLNRLTNEVGLEIDWAAQQDWMCEPFMLEKTGLSITDHQKRTVDNFIQLRKMKCDVHIIPVLQGYSIQDYFNHFEMFEVAGFDLRSEPLVGVGSVCRRQGTDEIAEIMKCLRYKGLKLHGFGVKIQGFKKFSQYLWCADSLAWSFSARRMKEHCKVHKPNPTTLNCANCLLYALEWREKALKGGGV